MRRVFLYPIDVVPVAVVTLGVLLALVPFAVPMGNAPLAAFLFVSFLFRHLAPVHQHLHGHLRVFRRKWLNDAYDFVLILASGLTTAEWELQHNRGHHRYYLTPEKDPSDIHRFSRRGPLQRAIFTVCFDQMFFFDALRIAREERGRWLLRRLWTQQALRFLSVAALLVWSPWMTLLAIIVPNRLNRWLLSWLVFAQHRDVPLTNVYDGSITRFGLPNLIFLNVWLHSAHHEKPAEHWTLMPARTAAMLDRMPASCVIGRGTRWSESIERLAATTSDTPHPRTAPG